MSISQPFVFSRGSCTDSRWGSASGCRDVCSSVTSVRNQGCSLPLLRFDGKEALYCANSIVPNGTDLACAGNAPPFSLPDASVITNKAILANVSCPIPSVSPTATHVPLDTPTGTSSTGCTPIQDEDHDSHKVVAVGAGVGVSLGVLFASSLGWALFERNRRLSLKSMPRDTVTTLGQYGMMPMRKPEVANPNLPPQELEALAQENNYFSYTVPPAQIIPETHATDSYQNVLFSLLRFKLYTGVYPSRVTVVTHEFKRRRFMEYHFPAIGLVPIVRGSGDEGRAAVIGINPPEEVTPEASLIEGEEKRGIGLWMRDRYGVLRELKEKRVKRGWVEGMEEGLFVNVGLEEVVEKLVRWEGGISGNEWFSRMEDLPWYRSGDIL
ncbi:DUF218 domain protein [Aspergillus flavus]|uniref:DUF218 domain protein n=1 Tax=Aspergillus flavus TaxID=5059 RepID=A0AB74C869_ASPFL|nr:DUF218 domain protein [Aspergillus flavus]RAQ67254.1 DUF218 domain protein [Aspergillus flavus]RMZ42483.1 DUF218 domain protein [Aspergillus flavus]